jgi:hypothetical protein
MQSCFKNSILSVIIIPIILAFPHFLFAQGLTGVFIMSSVGDLENTSNNSMSVTFNRHVNCLNVQNGAGLLNGDTGMGNFYINCEVNIKFNTLGIKLYPNPVIGITTLKLMHPPPLNDDFKISIWGVDGHKITNGNATGYELLKGMSLDFSMLQDGSYIIQITSKKMNDALKFIKVSNLKK